MSDLPHLKMEDVTFPKTVKDQVHQHQGAERETTFPNAQQYKCFYKISISSALYTKCKLIDFFHELIMNYCYLKKRGIDVKVIQRFLL